MTGHAPESAVTTSRLRQFEAAGPAAPGSLRRVRRRNTRIVPCCAPDRRSVAQARADRYLPASSTAAADHGNAAIARKRAAGFPHRSSEISKIDRRSDCQNRLGVLGQAQFVLRVGSWRSSSSTGLPHDSSTQSRPPVGRRSQRLFLSRHSSTGWRNSRPSGSRTPGIGRQKASRHSSAAQRRFRAGGFPQAHRMRSRH